MQFKKYSKHRSVSIQGLRSLKDTLPTNVKKVINKRGQIYSEILNNWKYIAGENLFKICFPKSYKNSNKFSVSSLMIMVKRGHEVDMEYSKKTIIDKINAFFGNSVVEKIKLTTFNDEERILTSVDQVKPNVTNDKYKNKIDNVKNQKIKKSLLELNKVFRNK